MVALSEVLIRYDITKLGVVVVVVYNPITVDPLFVTKYPKVLPKIMNCTTTKSNLTYCLTALLFFCSC